MDAIELFAGAGGLGMGISRVGFRHVSVIEWNADAYDTLIDNKERHHPLIRDWPLVRADVRDFDYRPYRDKVALLSGGPPCQPFSLGGKHRAFEDERDMFPQAVRAVRELRPQAFIFENVKGLTRQSFVNYLQYILLQLQFPELTLKANEDWLTHLRRLERYKTRSNFTGLRYNVICELLNAANYGVPQKRERVFMVGFRSDLDLEWSFPDHTHSEEVLEWDKWGSGGGYWERLKVSRKERAMIAEAEGRGLKSQSPALFEAAPTRLPWRTVREAICDLPPPTANGENSVFANHKLQEGARPYPGHTGSPLDEPAKTLKAGDHGVPGGENMLRTPSGSVRYFSIRESARLQTFPDDYVFHGSWTESMRQLGNAVPVALAEIVARSVKVKLEKAHGDH